MAPLRLNYVSLVLAGLLGACGGSDPAGPGNNGPPDPPVDMREIKAAPSFETDINETIQRRGCSDSSYHGAAGGEDGLMLTASAASNYAMLVDVDATQEPALKRVEPNDADNSYMVIKLEGRQVEGGRMPLDLSALDNIDLTNIKDWINNGAPDN